MEDHEHCPTSKTGNHWFQPFQAKADFEPQSYGDPGAETLYRRVEYMISVCACSASRKSKVVYKDA